MENLKERYYRGEIYYIHPRQSFSYGCEQNLKKGRPAIIISNDIGNKHSEIVQVVYLTTKEKPPLPTHVKINSAQQLSTAMCEQIETVSKSRIGDYINSISQTELDALDRAILISLGINCNLKASKHLEMWGKLIEEWKAQKKAEKEAGYEKVTGKNEEIEQITTKESTDISKNPEFIKTSTERDIYKEMYMNLLKEISVALS